MEGDFGIDHILRILEVFLWLLDPARHLLYAVISGLSGFCLMLTIFCVFGWVWEHLTHKTVNSGVVFIMLICSILLGAALGWYSHYLLDYGWGAWDLPFNGASMNLVKP